MLIFSANHLFIAFFLDQTGGCYFVLNIKNMCIYISHINKWSFFFHLVPRIILCFYANAAFAYIKLRQSIKDLFNAIMRYYVTCIIYGKKSNEYKDQLQFSVLYWPVILGIRQH